MTGGRPTPPGPPVGQSLRAALGSPTTIRRLSSSPRSRVWLVEFDGAPAIVKQIASGPGAHDRYLREETALRLAGRARPRVVPDLLATDPGSCVLVLEYLAGEGPDEEWMVHYATALARLHAAAGPADAGALPAWSEPGPADARSFLDLAAQLQVPIPPQLPDELDGLLGRLDPAGDHTLLHGDPCPDNAVHTSDGIRFIDLEQAAFGSGYTEVAYLWTGFPTCWCATSVPDPVRSQAETAYRSTWRSITGADPGGQLADACAGWLIRGDALVEHARRGPAGYLARLPHEDWRWGTATARQRLLHRLTVVAALAADHRALANLAMVSQAMRDKIQQRWPGMRPLPVARGNPIHNP